MSGSGGDTGYDYQADAIAFVAVCALTGQPLPWFSPQIDVPEARASETGGPGDDISVRTTDGHTIEVQAKHGLTRGADYEEAFKRIVNGLRKDPDLRAIMLVDRHASQVIREDLRIDLIRLGQGRDDGLKSITTDLLVTVGATSEEKSLFARLRLVVIDLDDGNDGAAAAQILLSKVVAPDKCRAAFTLLGKRGHQLIKLRGADDAMQCAEYLSSEVGVLPNSDAPSLRRLRFMQWGLTVNSDFFCPALQSRYPISKSWSSLLPLEGDAADQTRDSTSPLEAEIARYQEWTRLASSKRRQEEVTAESLIASHRLTVIVGGPGSGKTTLGKKLVWLTSRQNLAVRVRMPSVLALLQHGKSFNDALAELGSDAFGGSVAERLSLLGSCHLVVLDGLDECDPDRTDIANQISSWAVAHPQTRVCVLTRPIGHSPASLPGFIHAELLPLDENDIREIVDTLLEKKLTNQSFRKTEVARFMELVRSGENRSVASIAARNPLFLSFLVRLFLDGESLDGNRAALFETIVELIRKSPASEKLQRHQMVPSSATAWTTAETLGWGTIDEPQRSAAKLCELVAARLGGTHSDRDSMEDVVDFWSRQGLVERITVGARDAIVFVHLSLGEFLAGRYIAHQNEGWIRNHIQHTRRQAKWREPILLASGCGATRIIVSALLASDSPADLESSEALLAAAAIAENAENNKATQEAEDVCRQLEARLTSNVPLVSIESALSVIRLAPVIPALLTQISCRLRNHEYAWTRLAAFSLGLVGNTDEPPIDEVTKWLSEVRGSSDWPSGAGKDQWGVNVYELTKLVIPRALKRIAMELPAKDAKAFVVKFLSRGDISVGILIEVEKQLDVDPYRAWVLEATAQMEDRRQLAVLFMQIGASMTATRAVERSMMTILLDLLKDQLHVDVPSGSETTFPNLGRLISSMKLGQMPAGDLTPVGESAFPLLKEVFRGMIHCLPLDLLELRAEAQQMALELEKSAIGLLNAAQDVRELDLTRIADLQLDVPVLLEALLHPSAMIGWNALRLLGAYNLSVTDRELLKSTFMKSGGRTLERCAFLVANRFGSDGFDLFTSRWAAGPKERCGVLFQYLIETSQNDAQKNTAIQISLEGLQSSSPKLAELAAIALEKVEAELLRAHADAFAALFSEWKLRGSWCASCNTIVREYSCPNCHVVPPSPRRHLIPLLTKIRYFTFEDLATLTEDTDNGVAEESATSLIHWALADEAVADRVFVLISAGSLRLLNEFLRQTGQDIARMGRRLEPLLSSPSPTIRARVLGTVASGWMGQEAARVTLLAATKDSAPNVRSAAAKVLRSGSNDEIDLFS